MSHDQRYGSVTQQQQTDDPLIGIMNVSDGNRADITYPIGAL